MNTALDIAWAQGADVLEIPSPALLIGAGPARENLRRMLAIVRDPARLRPHIKTHKLLWLVEEQLALGITRFKCATIAEAEMCAGAGAPDVLLGLQPVGPNIRRLLSLQRQFPRTKFLTLVDDPEALELMADTAKSDASTIEVLVDLDVGQHRTGIAPGREAAALFRKIVGTPSIRAGGLHAYDGHLHQSDPAVRARACEEAFAPVEALRRDLEAEGLPLPRVVVGGTPTFPMHAARHCVECSPGTCVLWDAGYAATLPDLDFKIAAVLLTRVVSKPAPALLCLDLGHKAVASEMPHPRVIFPALPNARPVAHNEEHLVVQTPEASRFRIGDILFGVPWHICPTVALHSEVVLVGDHDRVLKVEARARRLTI